MKKNVFSNQLNMVTELELVMEFGMELYTLGPATENALCVELAID